VLRRFIKGSGDGIDLEKANKIVFITRRNDVVPVCARLTSEQAAAYFMLGESIETSAGDPTKAGQAKREVGTNPFIVGPEAEEGVLEDLLESELREGEPARVTLLLEEGLAARREARGDVRRELDRDHGEDHEERERREGECTAERSRRGYGRGRSRDRALRPPAPAHRGGRHQGRRHPGEGVRTRAGAGPRVRVTIERDQVPLLRRGATEEPDPNSD